MADKPTRFVISDENEVNSYGIRVMTAGIDISQYERNNILLYMHQRGRVIGRVINLQKEGPLLTGEPVFDEEDEFAAEIKRKVDGDWLRACSPELDVSAPGCFSDDPALRLAGQLFPTAIKSKLYEISICDIPGNDSALRLTMGGSLLLSKDAAATAEAFKQNFPNLQLNYKPKMKLVLSRLGLSENASEEAALAAIDKVKADADTTTANFILKLAKEHKLIKPEKEAMFLRLAKLDPEAALELVDFSGLKPAGDAAPPKDSLRLTDVVDRNATANAAAAAAAAAAEGPKDELEKLVLSRADWDARRWERDDSKTWLRLKREKPEIHEKLYKAFYSIKG
ncbi:hypothetical protein IC235_17615 [Hymenobacter sp. BT664]|uniref:Prohead protease n=1 Tax=Hymenobacter montanus TaxID=2771359 RepID=A0A927BFY1_9BACT|nr:hypothetical protein [Hymenobacter montanus]MBD2769711.1 hypothetical protein [Hymenobacter montanus]